MIKEIHKKQTHENTMALPEVSLSMVESYLDFKCSLVGGSARFMFDYHIESMKTTLSEMTAWMDENQWKTSGLQSLAVIAIL